ncbi:MAG: hypothetical protein Q9160_009308 [Pyrenula sp. 1 TL-2023]
MDHLPRPVEPLAYTLKAPLLTTTGYDHAISPKNPKQSYIDYPLREGWTPRRADQWRKIFVGKDAQFLAFLQRWLYFGLLECVLGRKIPPSSLAEMVEAKQYLSSRSLLQLAEDHMALRPGQEPDHEEVLATVQHATHIHLQLFGHTKLSPAPDTHFDKKMNLQKFIETYSMEDPRDSLTVTATSLLLDFVVNLVPRQWDGFLETSINVPKLLEPKTGPLWQTLNRHGWCPAEAAAIVERFSVSGIYYMTQIRPPNPSSHQQGGKCLYYKCTLRQLNDATYQTKHVPNCSGKCGAVGANPGALSSILVDEDTIPLINTLDTPWLDRQTTPGIPLEPWDGSKPFVAISHVWADGLGNPDANALPRCQMQRLSDTVQGLTGQSDMPFWLDTICVPPDTALNNMDPNVSEKQRKAQDQAIAKMRQTYEESFHVLVLDAWIISDCTNAMSDMEKLMRIFSCGWNTRLWTYQEGALAKRLSFKLKDAIYDMDEAILRVQSSQDWSLNYTLRGPLIAQYDSLRGFRNQGSSEAQNIKHLANALAFRATSVTSDETICLSALMGFNVQKILDVKDPDPKKPVKLAEARMTKFWSMFDRVPAVLLKFDGPTLPVDGYGWAPSSLLLSKDRPFQTYRSLMEYTDDPASRTDRGLNVQFPGLEFRSNVPVGLEFHVEDDEGKFYHFYFELQRFKDQAKTYIHNHSGYYQEELCIDPQKATGSDSLAFIFDPANELEGNALKNLSHVTESGILVALHQNLIDGSLDAIKLGYAAREMLNPLQNLDGQRILDFIRKSPQNLQDYQEHSLRYPGSKNKTLLCSKGRKIQPRMWRVT